MAGRLFDETGDRLTPTYANKKGRRYRYYVSGRLVTGKADDGLSKAATGWRLPAKPLEEQLARAVVAQLRDRPPGTLVQDASLDDVARIQKVLEDVGTDRSTGVHRSMLACIACVILAPGKIEITLDTEQTAKLLGVDPLAVDADALRFEAPFQFRKRGVEIKLIIGGGQVRQTDATLIRSIAKAHRYYDAIKRGASFEDLAASEKLSKRRILQLIDLAFLAPDIVNTVVHGDQPTGLTAKWLGQNPLPSDWQAQRRIVATR